MRNRRINITATPEELRRLEEVRRRGDFPSLCSVVRAALSLLCSAYELNDVAMPGAPSEMSEEIANMFARYTSAASGFGGVVERRYYNQSDD